MLNRATHDSEYTQPSCEWSGKRFVIVCLGGMIASAVLEPILFSLASGLPRGSELAPAILFGCLFGAWVGLIACVLFGAIRRLRIYATRSMLRMILIFGLLGAIAAAPVMFPFGDGFAMAFALAIEGAVFGGIIGVALGLILFLVMFRKTSKQQPGMRS
jgi:membrane associated rhomboid family serine protease